jgi:hypothetical protein
VHALLVGIERHHPARLVLLSDAFLGHFNVTCARAERGRIAHQAMLGREAKEAIGEQDDAS